MRKWKEIWADFKEENDDDNTKTNKRRPSLMDVQEKSHNSLRINRRKIIHIRMDFLWPRLLILRAGGLQPGEFVVDEILKDGFGFIFELVDLELILCLEEKSKEIIAD